MKFVYWSAVNSGGGHMHRLCHINRINHIFNRTVKYSFNKYIYSKDTSNLVRYFRCKETNNIVPKVVPYKYKWNYTEHYNFVDDRITSQYAKDKCMNHNDDILYDGRYLPYLYDDPNNYESELYEQMMNVDAMIRPYYLIGIVNYERRYNICERILSDLNQFTHIIPYKSNTMDSLISKLNIFDPPKQAQRYYKPAVFKTILDAYKRDKNIVWKHLDDIIRDQRNIEQTLVDLSIKYTHFDLDNDEYEFDIQTPRDYTNPKFEHNSNWNILNSMAEEYIITRGFKDSRLQHRVEDKI